MQQHLLIRTNNGSLLEIVVHEHLQRNLCTLHQQKAMFFPVLVRDQQLL